MASGGIFHGDHSVEWEIVAQHVRAGSIVDVPIGTEGRGIRHRGVDETDSDTDQWFTITIQRPKTGWPDETIAALKTFVSDPGAGLSFRVPVEDQNYLTRHGVTPPTPGPTQIKVTWTSLSPETVSGAKVAGD